MAAAIASAQTAPPNPLQDALAKQIGLLILSNTQCSVEVLTLNDELAKARKELDDIKKVQH